MAQDLPQMLLNSHDPDLDSDNVFPKLKTPSVVQCLHGRQRYEVAINSKSLGPDAWWSVKIYCLPEGADPYKLLSHETDQIHYETKHSAGEVALNMYQYRDQLERRDAFRLELTRNMWKGYRQLKNSGLLSRFNQLMDFTGHWSGFQLGSIERELTSHFFEEMKHCIDEIFHAWDRMTLKRPEVRAAVDPMTVEGLQRLAPRASIADRERVKVGMRTRVLFSTMTDPEVRAEIEAAILQEKGVIWSIKTFHENINYLMIAATIIKTLVIEELGKDSIYEALSKIWYRNRATETHVEVGEENFRRLPGPPRLSVDYKQLVIAALRLFPFISSFSPRTRGDYVSNVSIWPERCKSSTDRVNLREMYLAIFLRKVQRFNFNTRKVEQRLETLCNTVSVEPYGIESDLDVPDLEEPDLKHRSGRPFVQSYNSVKRRLFLPQLISEQTAMYPTTLWIQSDMIGSFLGGIDTGPLNSALEEQQLESLPTENSDLGISGQNATSGVQISAGSSMDSISTRSLLSHTRPSLDSVPTMTTSSSLPDISFEEFSSRIQPIIPAFYRRGLCAPPQDTDSESDRSLIFPR